MAAAPAQVSLNTVDNLEAFTADVHAGRWDIVLPQARCCAFNANACSSSNAGANMHAHAQVAQLQLPRRKMEDLYEQVVLARPPSCTVTCAIPSRTCSF